MLTLAMPVAGFGDLYAVFFNAIVRTFGTTTFETLKSLSILLAGFTVVASFVLRRDILEIVKWLFYVYIIIYVGFVPKASLEIIDYINHQKVYRVDNVPLGLALISSLSTRFSNTLTQLMETNFSMPDDLKYSQSGMVFSAQLMKAATQFEITDSRIDANTQAFIQQCVFYDMWFKKYTLNELVSTTNLLAFLKQQKMSPVRGIVYTYKENKTAILTCKEVFPLLETDWQDAVRSASVFYGKRIFGHSLNPTENLLKYLPLSYGFLTQASQAQADQIMKQTMMANAIERGSLHMGAKVNADAALKSYSYIRANAQKRLTNQTMAEMACYWLPLIKVSLELILYGAFIFIVLIAVFPFGKQSLKGYLGTLLWVQLWSPLFALFHLIASYYGQQEVSASMVSGLSMQTMTSMNQLTSDMVGLAGYMSMSVPAVAGLVLWGAQHNFAQLSQYIGGVAQSASSQAATEVASGNISLGNTSFGNHNAFNTSSNKFDTNSRVAGGASSMQLSDGTQVTTMPSGREVINMQGAISNTGINMDLSGSVRSSLAKSAEHVESASYQNMHSFGHSVSAAARAVNSLSHHAGEMQASGESFSQSASGGLSHALSEIEKVNNDIHLRTGLSRQESESLSASLYMEGKANAAFGVGGQGNPLSASIGGGGGISRNTTNSDSNTLSHAKDEARSIMDAHHYADNVDVVSRAVHDKSLRLNTETGNRLASDINHSLDRADSSRQEYSANHQKAEYLRKTANLSNEQAASFRNNLNQEFTEYVAKQPNQYHTGNIGAPNVSDVLQDTSVAQHYAEKFIQEKVSHLESNWQHDLKGSSTAIQTAHNNHVSQMGNDNHIKAIDVSNDYLQIHQAQSHGQTLHPKINTDIKEEVINQFVDFNDEVNEKKLAIHKEKVDAENNVKGEITRYKRHGLVRNMIHDIDHHDGGK